MRQNRTSWQLRVTGTNGRTLAFQPHMYVRLRKSTGQRREGKWRARVSAGGEVSARARISECVSAHVCASEGESASGRRRGERGGRKRWRVWGGGEGGGGGERRGEAKRVEIHRRTFEAGRLLRRSFRTPPQRFTTLFPTVRTYLPYSNFARAATELWTGRFKSKRL